MLTHSPKGEARSNKVGHSAWASLAGGIKWGKYTTRQPRLAAEQTYYWHPGFIHARMIRDILTASSVNSLGYFDTITSSINKACLL